MNNRGRRKSQPRNDAAWGELHTKSPRFVEAVTPLGGMLHGKEKDAIFAEDCRTHRRTIRLLLSGSESLNSTRLTREFARIVSCEHDGNWPDRAAYHSA